MPLFFLFLLMMGQTVTAQEPVLPIVFDGIVLDEYGQPIAGAAVQFWQTDLNGYYDHPNEQSTHLRDLSFQFYGTATTADDGAFTFKTVRPGEYAPRPSHIHFKVWLNGTVLLTSQFYFADENVAVSDMLILDLVDGVDSAGEPATLTSKTIVVRIDPNSIATVTLTPSQQEGPFYPVVDFFGYDNDLITLAGVPTAVQTTNTALTTPDLLILAAAVLIIILIVAKLPTLASRWQLSRRTASTSTKT